MRFQGPSGRKPGTLERTGLVEGYPLAYFRAIPKAMQTMIKHMPFAIWKHPLSWIISSMTMLLLSLVS
jgi:hypothetical protein